MKQVKDFCINTEGFTEEQVNRIIEKSMKAGAELWDGCREEHLGEMTSVELAPLAWLYWGVSEGKTQAYDTSVDFGKDVEIITFDQLDPFLGLDTEKQELLQKSSKEASKFNYIKAKFETVGEAVQAVYDNPEKYYFLNKVTGSYYQAEFQDTAWYWKESNLYTREEINWYDDIPEGGVLCWVKDTEQYSSNLGKVVYTIDDMFVEDSGDCWEEAIPLTKEEIMQFVANVPE